MIKITNLNKYFYHKKSNEIHVINNASFEFPKTGLITIFGESGSGKTTLMNVLGGLDDFHDGTIQIDDFTIKKYNSRKIDRIRNEKIGYIFQNYLLLQQRSVYDNLKLVLNMYDISEQEKEERIDYVLEAVSMLKYKRKNVSELSGGQQQRVAIARALIKSPSMILADEPTGNLDEKNTIQIMNIIKKISKDTLVILVSHEERIARSYSDYIIEVTDGKISNYHKIDSNEKYSYEDDQNIYLKEYKYQKIDGKNIDIEFYSNQEKPISVKIVYEHGKFYIQSDEDVVLVDKNSEIKFLNEHKKELDSNEEILENSYYLKPLKYVRTPSLSFKECFKLAKSNLEKMKKRTSFLKFPFIIIIMLLLFSVQSVISASHVDRQNLVHMDSRMYDITLEQLDAKMSASVQEFGFEKFYDEFVSDNPDIDVLLNYSTGFYFTLPDFEQLDEKTFKMNGFTLLEHSMLKEESLIYGRMPEKINEIVVEKWVIENTMKGTTLSNFMGYNSFINKKVSLSSAATNQEYTIVGIASNDETSIYMNKWALLNTFPSTHKLQGIYVCSISEFEKTVGRKLDKLENKYDAYINKSSPLPYDASTYYFSNKPSLAFKIVEKIDFGGLNYKIVVNDEVYEELKRCVLSGNYGSMSVLCNNEKEVRQVKEYVESKKEYYASGDIQATPENGYVGIKPDVTSVKLKLEVESPYYKKLDPYLLEAEKAVSSRLLITFAILVLSVIFVFFSMKSYAIKNIYDIGVYRALGIKKASISLVYAIEVLSISLKTTLIGGFICFGLTNIIASIPLINFDFKISFALFIITTVAMILLNVIVGVLPVVMTMRKTPSQILTKYDI